MFSEYLNFPRPTDLYCQNEPPLQSGQYSQEIMSENIWRQSTILLQYPFSKWYASLRDFYSWGYPKECRTDGLEFIQISIPHKLSWKHQGCFRLCTKELQVQCSRTDNLESSALTLCHNQIYHFILYQN